MPAPLDHRDEHSSRIANAEYASTPDDERMAGQRAWNNLRTFLHWGRVLNAVDEIDRGFRGSTLELASGPQYGISYAQRNDIRNFFLTPDSDSETSDSEDEVLPDLELIPRIHSDDDEKKQPESPFPRILFDREPEETVPRGLFSATTRPGCTCRPCSDQRRGQSRQPPSNQTPPGGCICSLPPRRFGITVQCPYHRNRRDVGDANRVSEQNARDMEARGMATPVRWETIHFPGDRLDREPEESVPRLSHVGNTGIVRYACTIPCPYNHLPHRHDGGIIRFPPSVMTTVVHPLNSFDNTRT